MTIAPNEIRIKGRRGEWLQTFVYWEDEWHVQAPRPTRAPAVLPGALSSPAVDHLINAGADLAIGALMDVLNNSPAFHAATSSPADYLDDMAHEDWIARNRRRLNSYPDVNGLLTLVPDTPIRPEKFARILDRLLEVGMHIVDVDQLREVITARR